MLCQGPARTAAAAASRQLQMQFSAAAPSVTVSRFYSAAAASSKPSKSSTTRKATISNPVTIQLNYLVERTRSGELPVYQEKKAGGTKKLTVIRKVQGNAQDLKTHILNDFEFKKNDVNVNPVTGHLEIKVGGALRAICRAPREDPRFADGLY